MQEARDIHVILALCVKKMTADELSEMAAWFRDVSIDRDDEDTVDLNHWERLLNDWASAVIEEKF